MASRRTVRTKKAAEKLGIKARRSAAARKGWQTRKERSVVCMLKEIDEAISDAEEEVRKAKSGPKLFFFEPPYLPSYFQTRVTCCSRPLSPTA
jgi:site-specific DNA-adenine methylase